MVGAFSDGHSALMRIAARLRHLARTHLGNKRYLCMDELIRRGALTTVATCGRWAIA